MLRFFAATRSPTTRRRDAMSDTQPLILPPIAGAAPTVVHLCAEYYPYARTGGLAEAAWGLQRYQHRRGLPTMAILPLYKTARQHTRNLEPVGDPFTLDFGGRYETFRLLRELDSASETPVCFIEHEGFFGRDGSTAIAPATTPTIIAAFRHSPPAVAALPRITSGAVVLHVHDWHAALAPVYMRSWWGGQPWYDRIPVVMSVHNGGYQGHFGASVMPDLGLPWSLFTPDKLEWYGKVNFLKGGLTHTDMATTVSPRSTPRSCGRRRRIRFAGSISIDGRTLHRRPQWDRPRSVEPGERSRGGRALYHRRPGGEARLQGRHAAAIWAAGKPLRAAGRARRADGDAEGARHRRPQPRPRST